MAKSGAQSLTFKSVTDKQTDKHTDKKLNVFWPPRLRAKSEPLKLDTVTEDLEHVLTPRKRFGV